MYKFFIKLNQDYRKYVDSNTSQQKIFNRSNNWLYGVLRECVSVNMNLFDLVNL